MKKYKFLNTANFEEEGKFYKGEVLFGEKKNSQIVRIYRGSKGVDVPIYVAQGSPLLQETTEPYKEIKPVSPTKTGYKVVKWRNDFSIQGKAAVSPKGKPFNVYVFDKEGNHIKLFTLTLKTNETLGIASGRGVEMSNGQSFWLISLRVPYLGYEFGYVTYADFYFSSVRVQDEEKAKNDAQALCNKLITNDIKLAQQINVFNAYVQVAKQKGHDVSGYEKQIKLIADSWQRRQSQFKLLPGIKVQSTSKIAGIGIAPLVVGIAVGAATVITGFIVYYFLKPEYNTSQVHSKYIADNEAALKAKLGEQGYNQLKEKVDTEIKQEAEKAYQEGKSEGTGRIIKPLVFMGLGFYLLTKFQQSGQPARH